MDTISTCPAPRVLSAIALSATSVQITFDRRIAPASVMASGSQFTIMSSGGSTLAVSAASVSDRTVTLTTAMQTGGTSYTVTVANSVRDMLGSGIDASANRATFTGFVVPAVVRINEINANIANGCDLIELRVVRGGSMDGFSLRERDTGSLVTFTGLNVATNDYIVVHMNSLAMACNPGTSGNETSATNQFPATMYARNYDSAYDWYSTDTGLTNTDNVFTLYNGAMEIVDAVLVANAPMGTAAGGSETQAATVASAGHWTMVGGGVPMDGFVDDAFRMHAVQGLGSTSTTTMGTTIQRINNDDTNTRADWNDSSMATWGANNPGQTNF